MTSATEPAFELLRFTAAPLGDGFVVLDLEGRFVGRGRFARRPALVVERDDDAGSLELTPLHAETEDGHRWRATYAVPVADLEGARFGLAVRGTLLELPPPDRRSGAGAEGPGDRSAAVAHEDEARGQAAARAEAAERRASAAERRIEILERAVRELEQRVMAAEEEAGAAQDELVAAEARAAAARELAAEVEVRAEEADARVERTAQRAAEAEDRAEQAERRAAAAEERVEEATERATAAEQRAQAARQRAKAADERIQAGEERIQLAGERDPDAPPAGPPPARHVARRPAATAKPVPRAGPGPERWLAVLALLLVVAVVVVLALDRI
ncbi:MAG TPA: hypothetical protein VFT50_18770 [Baekduia sp.]|nr:hypothetical protein [Baekduia sp.]